ncbi:MULTISPECIES: hypothetical protein [Micrococcales]|nr:hypothetical protein [Enteractinococcus coprophilus]
MSNVNPMQGIAIGTIAIVYGEGDDSPGLQGLGTLIVLGMIALGVRTIRRRGQGGPKAKLSPLEYEVDADKND